MAGDAPGAQIDAALGVLAEAAPSEAILGLYLYGSAVGGGLRPDSDLDLLVVLSRGLQTDEKERIVQGLLPISGFSTRPPDWRPIELTAVVQTDVMPWRYPPPMELQYGEWLRQQFLDGDLQPSPSPSPDLAVLLTMVRDHGIPVIGPSPTELLDAVPRVDVTRAILDELPKLVVDLETDTRNVLLTLARMWCTVATGEIRSKDAAADWVLERVSVEHRSFLARARDLYRGGGYGQWDDMDAVRSCAAVLAGCIREEGNR